MFQDGANYGPSREEMEANARRIVACVNACFGKTTEELETWGKLNFPDREPA